MRNTSAWPRAAGASSPYLSCSIENVPDGILDKELGTGPKVRLLTGLCLVDGCSLLMPTGTCRRTLMAGRPPGCPKEGQPFMTWGGRGAELHPGRSEKSSARCGPPRWTSGSTWKNRENPSDGTWRTWFGLGLAPTRRSTPMVLQPAGERLRRGVPTRHGRPTKKSGIGTIDTTYTWALDEDEAEPGDRRGPRDHRRGGSGMTPNVDALRAIREMKLTKHPEHFVIETRVWEGSSSTPTATTRMLNSGLADTTVLPTVDLLAGTTVPALLLFRDRRPKFPQESLYRPLPRGAGQAVYEDEWPSGTRATSRWPERGCSPA